MGMRSPLENTARLELRQARMAAAPAFLRGGFRPFFLGAGLWACLALAIWLWALEVGPASIGALDPLAWHRHEMLFGFVGAAIAGFALTAVPNWTGRLPIAGAPLAALALWWCAGRILPIAVPTLPLWAVALVDGGFFLALAFIIMREILQAKNRNLPVGMAIALFGLADIVDYAGAIGLVDASLGSQAGIALATLLVSLIGGRIVPSFTRNWMQQQGVGGTLPSQPGRFDFAVIAATAVALVVWLFAGPPAPTGILLLAAAGMQAIRLARWRGWRTASSPIVLALHLAYSWIPIGLALLGASFLYRELPGRAGIHALAVGAIGGMIAAVMTRASLGHTGRALHADVATRLCYAAIHAAALSRVCAYLWAEHYSLLVRSAGALWLAGFALFVFAYAPKLFAERQA